MDKEQVHTPFLSRSINGGSQDVYRFPNGYGASVVCSPISYGGEDGLYELAVLTFTADDDWELTNDTPITDDVLGHLTAEEVCDTLNKVAALSKAGRQE